MHNWFLNNQSHRIAGAILISILLHFTLFFQDVIHLGKSEAGRQITIQATLQPHEKAAHPKIDRAELKKHNATKKKQINDKQWQEKFMTRKGADELKIGEKQPDEPLKPEEKEPEVPDRGAILTDDMGLSPAYPAEAAKRGIESCVLAVVSISAAGEVTDVRILHADVVNLFDQSVIEAQRAAHYLPARKDGNNVPSRILTVANFILESGRRADCAVKYVDAATRINALPPDTEISSSILGNIHGKP